MKYERGQSMAEFALILPLFLLVVLGIFDGMRLGFYYNEVQEAARAASRWAAVEVARDGPGTWGDFSTAGNQPGTYIVSTSPLTVTGNFTPTIVGRAASLMNLADRSKTTVDITTPITSTEEVTQTNPLITNQPITVTVKYPFDPIFSFGLLHVNLTGRSVAYHE
jgi:Flp pilus assembly protein TadG